jgi:hypothetical protein
MLCRLPAAFSVLTAPHYFWMQTRGLAQQLSNQELLSIFYFRGACLKRYRLIPATGGEWAIRFPGFPFFLADKN